jgi:hypothetical protein
MLIDLNRTAQPAIGAQPHWEYLVAVMLDPVVYGPLLAAVLGVVVDAITANPARPEINSRDAGASVLQTIGSQWHAEFSRRFKRFPNGAARGVFGMALWHHLAGRPETWCFSGIPDPYGHGQDATQYWRV